MNRVDWDYYFMNIAKDVSQRATCMRRRWGAVIVNDKHEIVSTGYCGMPRNHPDCLERGACNRDLNKVARGSGDYQKCFSVHAEANALLQAGKDARGCTLYLYGEDAKTGKPTTHKGACMSCIKLMLNAGIRRVVQLLSESDGKPLANCDGVLYSKAPRELFLHACDEVGIPRPGSTAWDLQKRFDSMDGECDGSLKQSELEFRDRSYMGNWCPNCGRYMFDNHICPPAWKIWVPDYGETEDDARRVFGIDAEEAVERWAEDYDGGYYDYSIVSSADKIVHIISSLGGAVTIMKVSGEMQAVYHAEEITNVDRQ